MRKSGQRVDENTSNAQAILTMVAQVPRGRVATYGQIARMAGIPRNSRQVGAVLKYLATDVEVPWFRIVNSKGEISVRGKPGSELYQRELLESEGVEFGATGSVSLKKFGWGP